MLAAAFITLAIAVLLGSLLAVLHLREGAAPPRWPLGALHGLVALSGLGLLALALRGPPRGVAQGTESFGMFAAVLIALAALAGLVLLAARLRRLVRRSSKSEGGRRLPGLLIGIHATLAVGGFVLLLAYVLAA